MKKDQVAKSALLEALTPAEPVGHVPCTPGKKNRLLSWTELGAKHVGIVRSLLATCRLHDINPYDYFLNVLQRVGLCAGALVNTGEAVVTDNDDVVQAMIRMCRHRSQSDDLRLSRLFLLFD